MASNRDATTLGHTIPLGDPLADVVAGCRRHAAWAQQELVSRTQDRMYRALVRLVGVQDAEDVAQQVYLQVFRQLHQFQGHSSFATWLYRVTVNEAMQHLRRKRRRRWSPLNWEPEDCESGSRRQSEERELLDRALAGIEPELRAVFVLREVEGLVPDESLCVVVLSNADLEGLADMLSFDLLDAYLAGPEVAWDQAKWESTWLKYEAPGKAYRPRDEAKARLAQSRIPGTSPTRPLAGCAATYKSELYGDLVVTNQNGQLLLEFAGFTTPLTHWHNDSFYVRTPTRGTYDWLLTFESSAANHPTSVSVKHIGWDKDEPDRVFLRKQ